MLFSLIENRTAASLERLGFSLGQFFAQSIVEYQLYTRHHARHWNYSSKQTRPCPHPWGAFHLDRGAEKSKLIVMWWVQWRRHTGDRGTGSGRRVSWTADSLNDQRLRGLNVKINVIGFIILSYIRENRGKTSEPFLAYPSIYAF